MFDYSKDRVINKSFVEIVKDYEVLHFDEEPILFFGKNNFELNILASFIEEDLENKQTFYFYNIIKEDLIVEYLSGFISYKDVLESNGETIIVEKNFNNEILNSFIINISEIPEDYKPHPDSFCPEIELKKSFNYVLKLIGGLADEMKVRPAKLNLIQEKFSKTLEKTLNNFKHKTGLKAEVFQRAYQEGSFKLNFSLEFEKELFPNDEQMEKYINSYLKYCINEIHSEKDLLYDDAKIANATEFNNLLNDYKELHSDVLDLKDEEYKDALIKDISQAAFKFQSISDQIGTDFDSIQVLERVGNKVIDFGEMNSDYNNKITEVVDIINQNSQDYSIDQEYKEYSIYIYHLNIENRSGNAYCMVHNTRDEEVNDFKELPRPRFKITSDTPLENTKYTKSLHSHDLIQVQAKATKVDGKVRQLEILFEED